MYMLPVSILTHTLSPSLSVSVPCVTWPLPGGTDCVCVYVCVCVCVCVCVWLIPLSVEGGILKAATPGRKSRESEKQRETH